MTMSETVTEMSKPDEKSPISATKNGFSAGQEVNKAKDADDSGGGSLPSKSDVAQNGAEDSSQPEDQSPNKMKNRRCISFPKDSFVSGYLDPPDPWKNAPRCTTQELVAAYRKSCEKHNAKPMSKVLQQLEALACSGKREEKFVLKGEKIDCKHCETFEEIFRRVQFKIIDLESCHLDDECAVALFDMIEYYDSACQLNISFNKNIGLRGWQACSRLIRRTPSLTLLDIRNCDLNDRSIPMFGRALKLGSHLTVLHMENMYLSGRALIILVAALKMNETLQELFLADNRLMPSDGIHLGNLLKYNHSLTLLDLRNNHLQDVGVGHVCDGLYEQNLDRGLQTLVLWNNQMTYQAMASLSRALGSTKCLETLNLGHNNVTNEGIHILKEGLLKSKSLMRLGLQSTRLTCEGAVALAEYVADSLHLLRLDLRENDIKTAGLMALSLALKVNESVTRIDLDKETKKESGMKDYAEQQRRLQQDINDYLERNQRLALEREEEERRKLEERAQIQAAKQEVQAVMESVQEIIQASPQVLLMPSTPMRRRPSLLFEAEQLHQLTPQQSLESPHCGDVHPCFPAGDTGIPAPVVVPSVSVSSPPMSLDLQNPLTATSPVGAPVVPPLATVGGLPLPSALGPAAKVLPSPPVELLLSPQYYPKPTARKIFSVSRVIETPPVASPTVSSTGVLDTGPPVITSPIADVGSMGSTIPLLIPASVGLAVDSGVTNTVSPTLLCQDLAVKTVNTIIEQLVSDSPSVAIVPELSHGTASLKAGEVSGDSEKREKMNEKTFEGFETSADAMASFNFSKPSNVFSVNSESQKEADNSLANMDPLGVIQSPIGEPQRATGAVDCDRVKATSSDARPVLQGGDASGEKLKAEDSVKVDSSRFEVTTIGDEGSIIERITEGTSSVSASARFGAGGHVNNTDIPTDTHARDSSSTVSPVVMSGNTDRANNTVAPQTVTVENEGEAYDPDIVERQSAVDGNLTSAKDSKGSEISGQVEGGEPSKSSRLGDNSLSDNDPSSGTSSPPAGKLQASDSLLLLQGQDGLESQVDDLSLWKNMDFLEFGADDDDLSLFTSSLSQPAVSSNTSQTSANQSNSGASALSASSPRREASSDSLVDVSAAMSDTWLTVDASTLPPAQERTRAWSGEAGTPDKPDFFTSLTFNGLTQELASALSSIDESGVSSEGQEDAADKGQEEAS